MKRLWGALALVCGLAVAACSHAQTYYGTALVKPGTVSNNCGTWAASGSGAVNALTDSGVGCSGGNITVNDAAAGSAVLTPNAFGLSTAALLNNKSQKSLYFTKSVPTTGQDAGDYTCWRDANYPGSGTQPAGFVNTCFTSYTVARAGTGTGTPSGGGFEWNGLFRLDNYSNTADGTENVAIYTQGRKYGTAATWGAVIEAIDFAANPVAGTITDEHDLSISGTDNNNARVGLDFFARNIDAAWGGAPVTSEVAWGFRLNTDAYTTIKNGITFNGKYGNGINLAPATINQAAIILGDDHAECYDSACYRKKFFSAGAVYQSVPVGGGPTTTNAYSWSDAGQFTGVTLNASGGDHLFGGSTSSYPMLRRNGAAIDVKLADNSNLADLNAFNLGAVNVNALGNVAIASGSKLCLDSATCTYFLDKSGSNIRINTPSGAAAAFTGLASNLLATTTTSLDSTGRVSVASGQKVCLDGTTCANYVSQSGGTVTIGATAGGAGTSTITGIGINTPALNAVGNISTAGVVLGGVGGAGGVVAGDGSNAGFMQLRGPAATFRTFYLTTGTSPRWTFFADNAAESGSNNGSNFGIASNTDAGAALRTNLAINRASGDATFSNNVIVGGNLILATNAKICLNGTACTIYITYDGTSVNFSNAGSSKMYANMSTGAGGVSGALTSGLSTGVTCGPAAPTAAWTSNGGLNTHC